MTQKPLISIDKFSGSGLNGILYCEGLYPEVDNGKSVMSDGYYTGSNFNSSTTGATNLGTVRAILPLTTINNSNTTYNLYYDGWKIFSYSENYSSTIKTSELHSNLGSISGGDFIETALGNILFTQESYIGRGVRFKATGGSTTTIIDTTRNFGDLGFAANDKVTNLKTGIEYTITSISTTTNTNDTLNFSASGANTTGANDEIIAWENERLSISATAAAWQPSVATWAKQIKQYGDQYFFTNGNYIGAVSADEGTVDKTFKQLPAKHQALCMDVNNEKLIVSCNFNGKGAFLLWDGATGGWNNILKFDNPVNALYSYQSGWVFVSNGGVFYTDGWQIQKMYDLNSNRKLAFSVNPVGFNGLLVYGEILYCANITSDINLVEAGVYAIDLSNVNNGFTIIKCLKTTRTSGSPYCLAVINRFSNIANIQIGGENFVSFIGYGTSTGQYRDKSMLMIISLPELKRITGVGLNLSRYIKNYANDQITAKTRVVQVSVGDANRGILSYAETRATGYYGTTLTVDGTTWLNAEVGDQVYSITADYYGDRTFITGISGAGTAAELWTVDPAVSPVDPARSELKLIRVKNYGKKTITQNSLKEEIMFYPASPNSGILTNKIVLEIVFYGNSNSLPININEIKVYGD